MAVMSQMSPSNLEISAAGDFDVTEVLEMIYKYIGSIPADANKEYLVDAGTKPKSAVPVLPLPGKHIALELPDSDPRAISYVAGSAPNSWGFLADGTSVAEKVLEKDKRASDYDKQRRAHPLFAHVALMLLSSCRTSSQPIFFEQFPVKD